MKISVITVCFNSAATVGDTIKSFLAQQHKDAEMVVVDGASTDRTVQIVESFCDPRIRVLSEPDSGIYDAMNKGLQLVTGDAVGILNSDDTYHDPFALSRIASALELADIVYGDLFCVRSHISKEVVRIWKPGKFTKHSYKLGWMPPHPTFYVRRKVVDRVGDFDCSYKIASDYDFMLRAMSLHGFSSLYIPHTLVDFLVGGLSTSSWHNSLIINMETLRARQAHLNSRGLDIATFLRPARRLFQLGLPAFNRVFGRPHQRAIMSR